jgi:hypothetical protein
MPLTWSFARAQSLSPSSNEQCREVRGRYAIYVERDSLWIVGTKHLLTFTDATLDSILKQRGWEDHVAFGYFTICSTSGNLAQLTNGDIVTLKSFRNIEIRNDREAYRAWFSNPQIASPTHRIITSHPPNPPPKSPPEAPTSAPQPATPESSAPHPSLSPLAQTQRTPAHPHSASHQNPAPADLQYR